MAGHYATPDLAGVSLGSYVLWPTFMLLTGCTLSVTPIVAQLVGGGRLEETGVVIRQGLLIGAAGSVVGISS